ncbi:MAG: 2-amino-4-hydroxy-6-hydroxymethyldihydropteridine diphosphokinase [Anaerolineales bacterium]|nr:2-amino-4-hydroxy-6-hydroxymethyldihydropteridine diphosphokinase [Anaerolineales bacterium]
MMGLKHQACLLVGSNVQPEKNLVLGIELLRRRVKIVRVSSVWETPAVGSSGPDFLNAAVLVDTPMDADELKNRVLGPLEAQLGRVRSEDKNAPRPIDIDIIIYDKRLLDPTLWQHAYRAVPVAEVLPDYRSNEGKLLSEVASQLAEKTPVRLRSEVSIL